MWLLELNQQSFYKIGGSHNEKNFKKVAALILVVLLTLSSTTLAFASQGEMTTYPITATNAYTQLNNVETFESEAEFDAYVNAIIGEGFMQNQRNALEIIEQFYNSLALNRSGDAEYPDYFAGFYLDDSGNLVMLVTENQNLAENLMNQDMTLSSLYESINIRFVEFSYAELHEARDAFRIAHEARRELGCVYALNVVGSGIHRAGNSLRIRLDVYNDRMIEGFRTYVFDSPLIIFEPGVRAELLPEQLPYEVVSVKNTSIAPLNVRVNPGQRISRRAVVLTGSGTMGYRVRRSSDNAEGFITSGHVFSSIGQRVYPHYLFATHLGTVERSEMDNRVDAAFVITHDTPGNTLPSGFTLGTQVVQSFWENQVVLMFGATTGASIGHVLDPDYDTTIEGQFIRGTVWTNVVSASGDSGGPVVVIEVLNNIQIGGIVWGGAPNFPDMVFIPAHRINSDFGVTPF